MAQPEEPLSVENILNDMEKEEQVEQSEQAPLYPNVFMFVDRFIRPMYEVSVARVSQVSWSEKWWNHDSVLIRMKALWRRFEQLRLDEPDTYMETFLRVHADYHMDRLLDNPPSVLIDSKKEDSPSVPLPSVEVPFRVVRQMEDAEL